MNHPRSFSVLSISLIIGLLTLLCCATAFAQTDCCVGRVGDANGEGGDEPTISDVTHMIERMFILPIVPFPDVCFAEWDINGSGGDNRIWDDISIGDISMLIDYLFITGPSLGLPYCPGHEGGPYGYLYDRTDCHLVEGSAATGETCLRWSYDGQGVLSLTHENASLNCCPLPTLTIEALGDTLFVSESDSGLCDCNCLYDIEYNVAHLPVGRYRLVVQEAVSSGGLPLEVWIDLTQSPTGSFCVERTQYPWGTTPSGAVVGHSECLSHSAVPAAASLSPDQSCVDIQYDGAGTLTLTHGNAGFNCCPTVLSAEFDFDGSTITITEVEDLTGGGCHCLCLYDLEMQINNLPPGQYRIVFVEPYRDDPDPALDFTVDLRHATSTTHCVERHNYPWGIWE